MLSFDNKVHYYTRWIDVLKSITIPLLIFISWDIIVTDRHWWFNDTYVMTTRILKLPPGEWLFFITVPFSTLFVWDVLHAYFNNHYFKKSNFQNYIAVALLLLSIPSALVGKEYTAIVLFFLSIVFILDGHLKTRIFSRSLTYYYIMIIALLMLIFNGYLTSRPVVLYDYSYQLNWKIFTIPMEDFLYGFSHLLLCTLIYEKIKMRKHE